MEDNNKKEENFIGLKTPSKVYNRRIFDSPSSKARILTPVKNALYKSDGNAFKFIKAVQDIGNKKNKENVNMDDWEL